jgi:phosphoserine phosphatase RsbU/P
MTLRGRLLLLSSLLVASCVVLAGAVLGYVTWQALIGRARDEALLAARLIARIAAIAEQVPDEVEAIVGETLVTESYLVAHLADLAQRNGVPPRELSMRLADVAARTDLEEAWVTDRAGALVASSRDEVDATIAEDDPTLAELARKVQASERFATTTGPIRRELDKAEMKYAGVHRPDGAGTVLASRSYERIGELAQRLGAKSTLDLILAGRNLDGLWVTDENMRIIAEATSTAAEPDLELARRAMAAAETFSSARDGRLVAAAPIFDRDGVPSGAAIVSLPTDELRAALKRFAASAVAITFVVLILGFALARVVARHIGEPITTIAHAAADVEGSRIVPAYLDKVTARSDEIGHLARVFRTMAIDVLGREAELDGLVRARTRELREKNEALEEAQRQMEVELGAAQALQAAILPHRFEPESTHTLHAYMMPARHMGGDFYDVFRIDEHRFALVIADVAGKGVPAAFFMAISRTVLRNYGREGLGPGDCLLRANEELCRTNPMELFVTVFYAVLDVRTGELAYANGGHLDPYVVHAEGGAVERLPRTGSMALGVMEEAPYPERSARLMPGDTILLVTDGIPEAMNAAGDLLGDELVLDELLAARRLPLPELVHRVVAAVERFVDGAPPSDDITCLALRYGTA